MYKIMFDVESNGLYGEGFAVGAVVSDLEGNILDTFELKSEEGEKNVTVNFVKENIIPYIKDMPTCETNKELRTHFYEFLQKHKGARVFSDCNYPVETNFLADVARDNIDERMFNMPYPLEDCSSFDNINVDRIAYYEKSTGEKLRKHNPLDDSIASLFFLNSVEF